MLRGEKNQLGIKYYNQAALTILAIGGQSMYLRLSGNRRGDTHASLLSLLHAAGNSCGAAFGGARQTFLY